MLIVHIRGQFHIGQFHAGGPENVVLELASAQVSGHRVRVFNVAGT